MPPPTAYKAQHQLIRISLVVLPIVLLFAIFDQWPFLYDTFNRGQLFGRDAHTLWAAGRALLETGNAQHIYDDTAFTAFKTAIAGEGIGWSPYFYPPPALLTTALLGLMPYSVALPVYTLIGLTIFLIAVGAPHFKLPVLLLLLIAPMTSFNIIMGQNGLISAALLIGGLRLISYRPALAGILFGFLAFKPILGLLIPLLLIIRKDWVAFRYASLTVIITSLLPTILWGTNVWTLFFTDAIQVQQSMLHHAVGIGMLMIPSAFNSARLLGLDTTASYIVHLFFVAAAMLIFLNYFIRQKQRSQAPLDARDILVLTLATTLISPYMHNYDFSMIEGAILLYCFSLTDRPTTPSLSLLLIICWGIGLLSLLANTAGIPVAPLALLIALYLSSQTPINLLPKTDMAKANL